jgi:peptide/nickel transport system substrate-binding protein
MALLPGCGGSLGAPVGGAGALPAPSGSLTIALPGRPGPLDPLAATTPDDQLLVRQINEPLVERLSGPYDDVRRVAGPALSVRPSEHATLWRIRLRPGIRFQDGARLDAEAVLSNAQRWLTTVSGQALLPDLAAIDAPRPDLVRFILARPDPRFKSKLASPQLGLVSPRALVPRSGQGATLARSSRTGTGPFELRERLARTVTIARNTAWWGTSRRLGPALDSVEFRYIAAGSERARLLARGEVQAAAGLDATDARAVAHDPLLEVQRGRDGTALGLERSVRGIGSADEVPTLSSVWLTTIAAG